MEYDYSPGTHHDYIAPKAPRLTTRVTRADGTDLEIAFVDGRLMLDGPDAEEFDKARAKYPALNQYVQRVNRERALELVREHQASQIHSIKGGIDSRASMGMQPGVNIASGKRLAELAPNNPEGLKQFVNELAGADNIVINEPHGDPHVVAESDPNAPPVKAGPIMFSAPPVPAN